MDLQAIYQNIGDYALNTIGVKKYTIGDVYTVWNSLNMVYGAFNAMLQYVEYDDDNSIAIMHYTFYYADKLKNDSSNIYDAQSAGFNVIRNVVKHLQDDYDIDGIESIQIYPFAQKFADILAGAYADVALYVPVEDGCDSFDKPEPKPEPDDNNDVEP